MVTFREPAPKTAGTAAPGARAPSRVRAASFVLLLGTAAAACNAVFGISGGIAEGTGGAGGGGSGGGPGCNPYSGDGTVSWSVTGSSDFTADSYPASSSVSGSYDPSASVTSFQLSAGPDAFWCGIHTDLHVSGAPAAGKTYTVVDRAAYSDVITFSKGDNAYVELTGSLPPDGGCVDDMNPQAVFGSVAGVAGATVQIVAGSGLRVDFTAQGAQLAALTDPGDVGSGTLTVSVAGHSDCFVTEH